MDVDISVPVHLCVPFMLELLLLTHLVLQVINLPHFFLRIDIREHCLPESTIRNKSIAEVC